MAITGRLLLLGCGILRKEIGFLIEKNGWPVDSLFLDSALHVDLEALYEDLTSALARHAGSEIVVFYGSCHPLMDKILEDTKTFRTTGQNCIEMLLGHKLFTEELSRGAFFLMEDWASQWDYIISRTFGDNSSVVRDIFREDRKYLLCLRTPRSADFTEKAMEAGRMTELPLRWMDVSLDHLESVLHAAITRKKGQ